MQNMSSEGSTAAETPSFQGHLYICTLPRYMLERGGDIKTLPRWFAAICCILLITFLIFCRFIFPLGRYCRRPRLTTTPPAFM